MKAKHSKSNAGGTKAKRSKPNVGGTKPKRFKLNVGGTKYEVSGSLLDQFPDSMLRRITSDTWNQSEESDTNDDEEIFIERNGERFQFVLDYMRDGKVFLPLSIPRSLFLTDMEYYAIDYDNKCVAISVADPKDMFNQLASYTKEVKQCRKFYEKKTDDIKKRHRTLRHEMAVEAFSCKIASQFFEELFLSSIVPGNLQGHEIEVPFKDYTRSDNNNFSKTEFEPHLNTYGLRCISVQIREERNITYEVIPVSLIVNVDFLKID